MVGNKRHFLSLEKKMEIIDLLKKGATSTSLMNKYGVAKSTIFAIKKQQRNIRSTTANTFSGSGKRKTLRSGEFIKMERALYKWFLKNRERNAPMSSNILKTKAKFFYEKIYKKTDFKASDGWFQNFKKRFGIRILKICGEKLSSQAELVEPFLKKLANKIKELDLIPDQLYNADETGLYWKLLPDKTYVSSAEKSAPGRKIPKQRLTFLACTNATGLHKIKPLVIGKAQNPRCFKNKSIPVDYDSSKTAWMTCSIFKRWFEKKFIPQVRCFLKQKGLPQKALLLLDNAPSHPPEDELISDDGQITTMFMPPNVTALIQPMDQNCIRIAKLKYRSLLLSHVVANKDKDFENTLKKINLRDAILFLFQSWNDIDSTVIAKCWKKILSYHNSDKAFESEDEIPLSALRAEVFPEQEINNATMLLKEIYPQIDLSSNDVYQWNEDLNENNEQEAVEIESDESELEIFEIPQKMSHADGIEAINKTLKYAEETDASIEEIMTLRKLRERAILSQSSQKYKQCKISNFFK